MYARYVLLKKSVCSSFAVIILSVEKILRYFNAPHAPSGLRRTIRKRLIFPGFMSRKVIYHTVILPKVFPISFTGSQERLCLGKRKIWYWRLPVLETGSILDVGSGTGYFAATMKNAGWHAEGIEINEKAREFSRSHFGLEVGPPDKIPSLETAAFDCITLWHVLEHFHDPFGYFSEIYRLLKPEGFCIVALPNSSSYDAEYFKNFWAAWDVPRHLWHFSPATFRIFSDRTGFELVETKTLPLDVFYISSLSEKYKGSHLSFIKGITKAIWFAFLSFFNRRKSSSMIYILRKL